MKGWKGLGQPLKLSPVIPVVKVVDSERFEGTPKGLRSSRVGGCGTLDVARDYGSY
jgi:hypothetical protein